MRNSQNLSLARRSGSRWWRGALLTTLALAASPQGLGRGPDPVDAGVQLEAWSFGTPQNEVAWGLVGHPSGVYVVGTTHGELHGPQRGGGDAFIRKVDANGAVLWAEQFGTPAADNAWKVGTDEGGNVYVVGSTEGDLAGPSHGGNDGFVRKYRADGQVLWTRQFGTYDQEHFAGVAASGDAVYVVGHREGAGVTRALVIKFDSRGNRQWLEVYGDAGVNYASGVAIDGEGNAYVVGVSADKFTEDAALRLDMVFRKYTPAGAVRWRKRLDYGERETAWGVAALGPSVYLAGHYTYQGDLENRDARVVQFSTDGVKGWDKRFDLGGNDYLYSLSALPGGVVFAGETVSPSGDSDGYVVKLDPENGRKLWQTRLATPKPDAAETVVITPTGVYAAGETGGTFDSPEADAFLIRLAEATGRPMLSAPVSGAPYRCLMLAKRVEQRDPLPLTRAATAFGKGGCDEESTGCICPPKPRRLHPNAHQYA